ncbi:class I SAM-dependent methyltransferase [Pseudoduganella albidiflava]|nr:class I SAM-dependent methyltransferase [Pseudoduganella albidiflava]
MMPTTDARFAGTLPYHYERLLVPMLFEPYALDLVRRAAGLAPAQVLEIAAGTGIVTRHLAAALPAAHIVATDLNPDMLAVAQSAVAAPLVTWRQADAMALPFGDGTFDLALCQFGVMFFPDKPAAFAQVRRVLRPGGRFLFNVWDALDTNELASVLQAAMDTCFPGDPPRFFTRTPHGYHDRAAIAGDLALAGFARPSIDTVALPANAPGARAVAEGFCQGTPLRAEIEARGGDVIAVTAAAADHLERHFGAGEFRAGLQAHVISALAA